MEKNNTLPFLDNLTLLPNELKNNIVSHLDKNSVNNLAATSTDWRETIAIFDKKRRDKIVNFINFAINENRRPFLEGSSAKASICCSLILAIFGLIGTSVWYMSSNEKDNKKLLLITAAPIISVVLGFLICSGLVKLATCLPKKQLKNHLQFFKSVETSTNNNLESLLIEKDDEVKLANEKTPLLSG